MESIRLGVLGRNATNKKESMTKLLVPGGTTEVKIVQAQITTLDNGVILNRIWVITEAGRPPYQRASTLFYPSYDEAVKELQSENS